MERNSTDKETILREKLIYRYVQAMDQGDMEQVATVLEAALSDPELDRIINEINQAYLEEEQLTPIAQDAEVVRELIREHLTSAFETKETHDRSLTVGEVAARLKADHKVPEADETTNRLLLDSSVAIPIWLSGEAIKKLAQELGVTASKRFWRAFKETAIMLNIGSTPSQAQLLAAREERAEYRYKKDTQSKPSPDEDNQQENSQ